MGQDTPAHPGTRWETHLSMPWDKPSDLDLNPDPETALYFSRSPFLPQAGNSPIHPGTWREPCQSSCATSVRSADTGPTADPKGGLWPFLSPGLRQILDCPGTKRKPHPSTHMLSTDLKADLAGPTDQGPRDSPNHLGTRQNSHLP